MDTYRAKRNVAMREGVWRQGTDRDIEPSEWGDQIEAGQIVRVGPALIEEVRPARDAPASDVAGEGVSAEPDGSVSEPLEGDGTGDALPPAEDQEPAKPRTRRTRGADSEQS